MAMKKRPPRPRARVGSAEFKARCLELVDHVREARVEYLVTRHGRPVARLVPVEPESSSSILGCLDGSVLEFDRPFDPVPGQWTIDPDTDRR